MARSSTLGTLFRYELKMLLRDRRTLFFSVLLPLLVLPGMFLIMQFTADRAEERREGRTYEYVVVGERAELARGLVTEALAGAGRSEAGGSEAGGVESAAGATFQEVDVTDPDSALQAGGIHVVVEGVSAQEAARLRDSVRTARQEEARGRLEGRGMDPAQIEAALASELETTTRPAVPLVRLRFRGNRESSQAAAGELRSRLLEVREARRNQAYREAGLPVDPEQVAAVELQETASPERASGATLALWLTPMLVLLMLSGGSIVAVDTISGEKERGTLETLLTTSARRSEIVKAKQLLIISVGFAITLINIGNLALYLGLGLFELPPEFVISVSPAALGVLLLLFLPLTVLISSALLMLSGYSKSYKEYQIYFLPVLLVFALPSAAAVLPGLELSSVIAVVPLANISVAVREVLTGEYDWPFLALTVLTTTGVAAWMARLTERTLSTEKLISAAEMDEADLRGGPALFPRRVIRWFGVLWVVFFLSSLWFVGELGIRLQILYNVVGLFLGASLLMMWRYRLDPREALALRMPRPAVWPAVLLGAPSAFIVGLGVGQLGQYVLPIPEEVLRAFGEFLLPPDLPLWQVIVFLAVLPGICEEIAFRGVLLHGLRKRFRPVGVAVAVGLIFGFFHVDLFRILPVSYLGIVLAAVTLATGSIFPAMLWHALNNAIPLVSTRMGWWGDDLAIPLWLYAAALLGLLAAGALIWSNRTPYPGLRRRGRG